MFVPAFTRSGGPRPPLFIVGFLLISLLSVSLSTAAAVDHVIHISIDGLRSDLLEAQINASPLLYSNFKRFVDEGASTFNARTDYTHTNTIPNHTAMLTGRPVLLPTGMPNTTHHGYINNGNPGLSDTLHNSGNPNLSYIASAFDVAHDNGLSTALYASKSKFLIYDQSYNATTGAVDTTGPDNGRDKIDTYVQKSSGFPSNASTMHTDFLTDMASSEYNYTFLHYRDPDSAGHASGWGSPIWNTSVQNVDGYLGDVLNLVETDAGLINDTVIIITSDHGGTGTGHSSPTISVNYTIPVFVWGSGVAAGSDLYDLNSTTRVDPGTGRPTYTAAGQPIRNGDTGNLALDLLGLSAVPGSLINNSQDLQVGPNLSADYDGNGIVNGLDFLKWQRGESTNPFSQADLALWEAQYGGPPLLNAVGAVPEPTTYALPLAATLLLFGRRRR